jgi:hypothetical protein
MTCAACIKMLWLAMTGVAPTRIGKAAMGCVSYHCDSVTAVRLQYLEREYVRSRENCGRREEDQVEAVR